MKEACQNCRFFTEDDIRADKIGEIGVCRRRAPRGYWDFENDLKLGLIAKALWERKQPEYPFNNDEVNALDNSRNISWPWPPVFRLDWCGEYEKKSNT